MSTTTPDTEYLEQRLKELSITPQINQFIVRQENNGQVAETPVPFFEADVEGNIVINYFNLHGNRYSWKKEDNKWPIHYQRKRLRKPKPDQKYHQDKGSGQFPFFTPGILKKYRQCKDYINIDDTPVAGIETLIVIEGEFKAFKGDMIGLDIIGIPSIHGFYNGDVRGKLHEDIQELIITCQVKNIVFLVDADLLSVKWEDKKDLAKRPESFFSAVKLFRESLQLLIDDDNVALEMVYLMHLQIKFMNEAKGLDDLLVKYSNVHDLITKELTVEFQFAKQYFAGKLLNDVNKDLQHLRKYLGLSDEQEFYKCYGEFIGDREFLFRGRRFEYDKDKREVFFVRHEDADKYMRVGTDWIRIVRKRNKFDQVVEEMKRWNVAEIHRDYRVGKNADMFIEQLKRFDDFCNEPAWNGEYKRVHNGCYNLCNPLMWDYTPGSFPNIYKFLKHAFQGKSVVEFNEAGLPLEEKMILGDQFSVILDWITILIKHPKHPLPVPILVSKENRTGKSTFLKLLNMIFGSNMCVLGNEQFKMKFNGHYITKFVISIDEGFLDVDKKAEKERLKQLVTATSCYLENKGMDVTEVPFYGKLIICSNDADRVMKIDEGESRWFVVKVPELPKVNVKGSVLISEKRTTFQGKLVDPDQDYLVPATDPDMDAKMMKEIPAFLHFLKERSIFHPRVDRLWFDPEWFITDQMRLIVETTKNRIDRVFEEWLSEQFLTYRLPVLRYPLTYLTEIFNDPKNSKYRIDNIELKAYLVDREGLKPDFPQRINIPVGFTEDGNLLYRSVTARPMIFKVDEWLNEEQLEEWRRPVDLGSLSGQEARAAEPLHMPMRLATSSPTDDLPF
ncbi:MAG: primase-helicase family protein [Bacteroidota bacterium]